MKAKKTIRKLHHQPATRKLAHWQRDYALLGRRLNTILALVGDAEFQLKALQVENAALRAKAEATLARIDGAQDQPLRVELH